MSEESRENAGGVIARMLRSLEDRHLDIVPSAELEKAEPAVSPANSSSDEVLEMAGDFNYDGYQVVRREFFAHINEPSVTFNNYKFYVNTACLNRFPQVDYVQVLVNQEGRILAIRPCRAEDRDACAWCTNGSGRRKPKQITCKIFFAKVFSLMGWNLDYRYKLLGRIIHAKDEWLIAFDLTATEVYQRVQKDGQKPKSSRPPVFPEGWRRSLDSRSGNTRNLCRLTFLKDMLYMGCAITSLLLHQSSQTRLPLILIVSPFWEDKDMNHENQLQAYLTLDPARNRIRIHRQTIRLLKNPAYVQFLVNPEELYIAVLGSDKPISGGTANKVRMSSTSQQSIEFYSTILIKNFSELLGGFDLRFNYQLTGEIDQINRVTYFSLKTVKQLERRRLHDRESI